MVIAVLAALAQLQEVSLEQALDSVVSSQEALSADMRRIAQADTVSE
jgi:hypothetical protein